MTTLDTTPENISTPIVPAIKVLGLGGAGCNTIDRLFDQNLPGVELAAANTDTQALQRCRAKHKIQLGPKLTHGLGAGGKPEIGEAATEESFREILAALEGAEIVFLTAGMGGGTGTGSISIAARIAKSTNAVVVAIITSPFSFEFGQRQFNANEGIAKLRPYADTLIIIPNDRLLKITPANTPMKKAFAMADSVLQQSVQALSYLCTTTGLLNIDYAHIKRLISSGGGTYIAFGKGEGNNKALHAIENALRHPLLDEIPIEQATAIIANFRGGDALSFAEITEAMQALHLKTDNKAEIIPGMEYDPQAGNKAEVVLVITGVGSDPLTTPTNKVLDYFKQNHVNDKDKQKMSATKKPENLSADSVFPEYLEIPSFLRKRQIPIELLAQGNERSNS